MNILMQSNSIVSQFSAGLPRHKDLGKLYIFCKKFYKIIYWSEGNICIWHFSKIEKFVLFRFFWFWKRAIQFSSKIFNYQNASKQKLFVNVSWNDNTKCYQNFYPTYNVNPKCPTIVNCYANSSHWLEIVCRATLQKYFMITESTEDRPISCSSNTIGIPQINITKWCSWNSTNKWDYE